MPTEPLPRSTEAGMHKSATNTRWRPWYSAIADYQLRNPMATIEEIATALGRGKTTIACVVASDIYKYYFAERRRDFTERHDAAITASLNRIAVASLDTLASRLETPAMRDRLTTQQIRETATAVLDRLGFAPRTASAVSVNVNSGNQTVVVAPVALDRLAEARSTLRAVEAARAAGVPALPSSAFGSPEPGALPALRADGSLCADNSAGTVQLERADTLMIEAAAVAPGVVDASDVSDD